MTTDKEDYKEQVRLQDINNIYIKVLKYNEEIVQLIRHSAYYYAVCVYPYVYYLKPRGE